MHAVPISRRAALLSMALAAGLAAGLGTGARAGIADWFTSVSVGKPLPEHDVRYLGGSPPGGARLQLIDFWATWCAPCLEHVPKLNALHEYYGPLGLAVVALTKERAEVVTPYVQRLGMKFVVGVGSARPLQDALRIKALPYAIVVDRRQVVLWRGQPDDIDDKLIEGLLKRAS